MSNMSATTATTTRTTTLTKETTVPTDVLIDIEDTSTTLQENDIKKEETIMTNTNTGFNRNVIHFLAGGISGSIAAVATQPLDVLKTRFQSSANLYNENSSNTRFKLISSLKQTFQKEGIHGLFRGLIPNIAGIFPSRAIYFATYSGTKEFMSSFMSPDSPIVHIISAAACGVVVPTIMNPMFLIKTRIQLERYNKGSTNVGTVGTPGYTSYTDCIKRIYRDEGIRAFYKGLTASFLGIAETAIYFVLYEQIKHSMHVSSNEKFTPFAYITVSGGCKLIASAITYPHEVVRTRMREMVDGKCRYDKGMINAFKTIAKEEGRRGLYSGMGAHLIRVVPNTAIMFLTYEFIIHRMFDNQ
ncbi:hypothetical protein ABK040_007038 [Willaertia magna]